MFAGIYVVLNGKYEENTIVYPLVLPRAYCAAFWWDVHTLSVFENAKTVCLICNKTRTFAKFSVIFDGKLQETYFYIVDKFRIVFCFILVSSPSIVNFRENAEIASRICIFHQSFAISYFIFEGILENSIFLPSLVHLVSPLSAFLG